MVLAIVLTWAQYGLRTSDTAINCYVGGCIFPHDVFLHRISVVNLKCNFTLELGNTQRCEPGFEPTILRLRGHRSNQWATTGNIIIHSR